ncbi:MAG: glycosyltransferase [Acidobacteriaceae bacterium]
MLLLIAIPVLLIWLYLVFARGGFWRVHPLTLAPAHQAVRRIAAIIPARNEADAIALSLSSLLSQRFSGDLYIFVVDDNSTDRTAQRAREAVPAHQEERLSVISGAPLPPGWSGKVWAMQQGLSALLASGLAPDYLLLTDADIVHAPESLTQLISIAESGEYDLTSLMVRLHCKSFAERLLIPAFVYFFFLLYPPQQIADHGSASKTAGAAGGCILLRPDALESAGGFASIRNEIIDDCSLARRIKQSGGKLWLGIAPPTHSIRGYRTFHEVRDMIARTAFNQLCHSWLLLLGCLLGIALTFVAPLILLFFQPWEALLACILMFLSYRPIIRYYRLPFVWTFTVPIAALFYMYATLFSAVRYARGEGGEWKGRAQDRNTSLSP